MTKNMIRSTAVAWAHFRFSVIGSLLAAPPARGELGTALQTLAAKTWIHPVHGREARFAVATLEAWYYKARGERDDPVGVLRRVVRKDSGKVSLATKLVDPLRTQYRDYPHWSYQLSTITRGCVATCSGICRRPPRISCMDSGNRLL